MKSVANIQILRLFAAFTVLFGHTLHELESHGGPSFAPFKLVPWGAGVDIFFIISGFVMYVLAAGNFGQQGFASEFFRRRLLRIVPPYWFFTALMLVATVALPGALAHAKVDLPFIAASFAFLPWPDAFGELHPVLGLGWTLNYEMLFYVVLTLALLHRRGLWIMIAVFLGAVALNPIVPDSLFMIKFWSNPIIIEFLIGLGLAHLYRRGVTLPGWLAVATIAAGVVLIVAGNAAPAVWGGRLIFCGLPAALIAAGAALGPELKGMIAAALGKGGDASYALYLSHPFTINVVGIIWWKLNIDLPLAYLVVACGGAIAAALILHFYLEAPFMRRTKHFGMRPAVAAS